MAQYTYSSLANGASINFDPNLDVLTIDDPLLVATLLIPSLSPDGRGITFEQQDMADRSVVKTITLLFTGGFDATNMYKAATNWLVFSNGTQLLIGDNTTGTTADESGSTTLTGTTGNDLLISFGASDTLNGGSGDDVLVTHGSVLGGGSGTDAFNGGDGIDTLALNFVAGLTGYTVDLLAGTGSIAASTSSSFTVSGIENVDGSDVADNLTGDTNGNVLWGWDGADILNGGDGNDTLNGGSGNDSLSGGNGTDTADYGSDPDSNADGFGVAVSIGSSQSGSWFGIAYNVVLGANGAATDGWGNTDDLGVVGTLENIIGSSYNDVIFGNNAVNHFIGGTGNDLLIGAGGNDILDGGPAGDRNDTDWVSYKGAAVNDVITNNVNGVRVDLGAGTASGNHLNTGTGRVHDDVLLNIDGVIGSDFNDSLVGGSNSTDFRGIKTEWFQGGIGADSLDGGWTDTGTAGMDAGDLEYNWARYEGVAGAVTINLSTNIATNDGEGGSDVLTDINAVWGGTAGDSMTGGNTSFDYRELFNGGAGSDTIDGGSGTDVALYRNSTTGISITLASGSGGGSDGLGGTDDLTSIEVVVGSDHDDTITGGAGDQTFQGRKGADNLDGGANTDTVDYNGDYDDNGDGFGVQVNLSSTSTSGNWRGFNFNATANQGIDGWGNTDTLANFENITGSIYNDVLVGNDGNNSIRGERGDDLIGGRGGDDIIDGGDGNDMVSYRFATGPVQVDLGTNTASGSGNDTLISIEQVRGSDHADTLTGDETHVNTFLSSFTAQVFEGGLGNDTIDGGDTRPGLVAVASYTSSSGQVTVNLGQGWAADPGGQDTLRNIGFVTGSNFNDSLVGGGRSAQVVSSNLFESFEGGAGNDTIDGGGGTDRVSYSGGAISANLATGQVQDGHGTTDTLLNIEQVRGSMFHDIMIGNSGNNAFEGRAGNDTIDGAGNVNGVDTLRFDQAPSAVAVQFTGVGSGGAFDGYGSVDTFTGIESVRGSDHNDTMLGGSGNETFEGMAGNDSIMGGAGSDTVSYGSSLAGVSVTLVGGSGSVTDSWGGTDSLDGIENITGSQFGDTIVGDTTGNVITALDGNDTITGGQGNDNINGGFGFDVAHFSGAIGNYTITATGGGGYTVVDNVGLDGSDTLSGVEQFVFASGGPQNNAMTYTWSSLPDGAAFYFDPTFDLLVIDGGLSATDLDFSPIEEGPNAGRGVEFTQWNEATGQPMKQIFLLFTPGDDPANMFKISSLHISFANGSVLKLGDDTTGVLDDTSGVTLTGGAGNDVLVTVGGSQTLNGMGGDDFLVSVPYQSGVGSSGTDVFIGGDGNDWVALDGEPAGSITQYTVNLTNGTGLITTNNATNSTFTVATIENVEGSDVADHITGNAENNQLFGWDGNDTILGGAGDDSISGGWGSDSIDGGVGRDLLDYSDGSGDPVTLDLGTGIATQGGDTDTIAGIEHVIGAWNGDTLTADETVLLNYTLADNPFTLEGLGGNDTISGGSAAPSSFVTASYANSTGAVNVNLATGTGVDGMGGTDTLSHIDGVVGSAFNDSLTGGSSSSQILSVNLFEQFEGGLGNDTIDGGDGGDRVNYQNNLGAVTVTLDTDQDGGNGFNGTALENNGVLPSSTDTLVNIEQVRGSNFDDSLMGSSANNSIEGMGGSDQIDGGAGFDQARYSRSTSAINATFTSGGSGSVVDGLGGTDTLYNIEEIYGSDFADTLTGGSSNDSFLGMKGNDTISGGAAGAAGGYDRASYVTGPVGVGVTVIMSGTIGSGTATDQYGNTDTLISIESIQGSHGADTLTGNANNINTYLSSYQAETFEGMAGNDTINGGSSAPTHYAQVTYANGPAGVGVSVNLGSNTATDAFGNTDTLTNIDGVIGSSGNDTLTGGSTSSQIVATGYFESFEGGAGDDTIDGGMGTDRVAYNGGAITLTLGEGVGAGTASDGYGNTDTLYNIEQVRASMSADTLTGNSAGNAFEGRGGADIIDGAGGIDTLRFDGSASAVTVTFSNVTAGSGTANDGGFTGVVAATDTFSNIEAVRGSDWNDTFLGALGDQTFEGMAGNDNINGGAGSDTVSYASSLSAVTVTLSGGSGSVTDHWGGTDSLFTIENITGSQFGDTLTGDELNNVIRGLGGADSLDGGAGIDVAAYAGARADYTVTRVGGGYTVVDTNTGDGDEGSDTLAGVERLQFSDQTVMLGLTVRDFNGDGRSDVLLRNSSGYLWQYQVSGTTVTGGGGVVNPGADWQVVGNGDYNGDGKSDILLRNSSTGMLWQYQLNGTAITASAGIGNPGTDWKVVGGGDYNGDGKSDILLRNSSGALWQYQMNGSTISGGGIVANPGTGWQVAGSGDYNGDGKSDILLRNDTSGALWLYQMDGSTLAGGGSVAGPGSDWKVAGSGDYNGDGRSDILIRSDSTGVLWQYQMNGTTISGSGSVAGPGTGWKVVGSGDYNGDGKSDILIRNDSSGVLWEYQMNGTTITGSGSLAGPGTEWTTADPDLHVPPAAVSAKVANDYNGDGKSDLLLQNTVSGVIWEYQLNGTAVTGSGGVAGPGVAWKVVGTGDYNGDGKSDILLRNDTTGVLWQYQLNGSTVTGGGSVAGPGTDWKVVGSGDYNGDGKSDILLRSDTSGTLWQYQMNGTTITGSGGVTNPGTDWKVVGNGDYNGDGKSDILLRSDSSGTLWQYQLNGTTITGSAGITNPGTGWKVVGNGDYNGDGKSDILIRNDATGLLWEYQMNGNTISGGAGVTNPGTDWKVVGDGDYNGDGKADILLRNDSNGTIWEYQLNGTTIAGGGVVTSATADWGVVG